MAKKEAGSTSVATRDNRGMIAETVPDFMKGKGGRGAEDLSSAALSPPRLKMAQALSPELSEIESLKPGYFFNSGTRKVYGPTVRIIPVYASEAYYLFAPRVKGRPAGGLLARADDGKHWDPPNGVFEVVIDDKGNKVSWVTRPTVSASGLHSWGTSDPSNPQSPPAATFSINMVCLLPEYLEDGPSVGSFTRSAISPAKAFASSLRMSEVDSFGRIFELSSLKVDGPSGAYYEPRFKPLGFVSDPELFTKGESIYKSIKRQGYRAPVDETDVGDAGGGNMASARRAGSVAGAEAAATEDRM